MPETGTGSARVARVFRSRVEALWPASAGAISWPEDTEFIPPEKTERPDPPAAVLRMQFGRLFEQPLGFGGGTSTGQGSVSLLHGVQVRPGMLDVQEAGEAAVRNIGDPSQNDEAEDVWTMSGIEVNHGVSPRGLPEKLARGYEWTQYVIPFQIAEGFI